MQRHPFRGALTTSLVGSGAIQAANVVTGILLARSLGPALRGELAAIVLWPSVVAAIAALGVSDAATFLAARRDSAVEAIVGSVAVVGAVQSALAVGVGAVALPLALHRYDRHVVWLALVFLAHVPLNLLALHLASVVNGRGRVRSFQVLRLVPSAAAAVGLAALALAGRLGPGTAVAVYLAGGVVTLAVAAAFALRLCAGRPRLDRPTVRGLLSYGVKTHVSNVSSLANERLDQLVISVFLSPVQLGLYVIAVTLTSLNALLASSVSLVALPAVAAERTTEGQAAVARRVVRWTLLASTLVAAPLLVFTPLVIRVLYGPAFLGAATVCRILLVGAVVLGVGRALGSVLKGAGVPLAAGAAELAALAVTAVALAALLPLYGITGAGVASLLAYAVGTGWMVRRAGRRLGVGPATLLLPRRSRPAPLLAPTGESA